MKRFLLRSSTRASPTKLSGGRVDVRPAAPTWKQHWHWLSTTSVDHSFRKVSILYGSQTGTAQLFAMQLQQALQGAGKECSMKAMAEVSPSSLLTEDDNDDCLNLFLISTTGVGEFPSNAKSFYEALSKDTTEPSSSAMIHYAIFALGNSQAHPNHFCAAGKALEQAFQTQFPKAVPVLPVRLGDDALCIDEEFDQWQETLIRTIRTGNDDDQSPESERSTPVTETSATVTTRIPTNYPELHLSAAQQSLDEAPDLLDIYPKFYKDNCRQRLTVSYNTNLHPSAVVETGLHEMHLSLPSGLSYETGDHIMIYPRNSDILVHAYLSHVLEDGVDPGQIVHESSPAGHYPHPSGISVYQTLSHCVDLTAPPSPSFARWLTSSKSLEYRQQISQPRRTVLDLILESSPHPVDKKMSLTDLLYQLPPLQPRYYSIASAVAVHPNEIYLTYRPVHYISSRGSLRHGLCTKFLQDCQPSQTVVAGLVSNPAFRLPSDPMVPVILIGGGCGVAPIRGFLEDLVHQGENRPKNVSLFLGFRDPADQVYHELVESSHAFLQACHVGYASNGSLVTKALAREAEFVHQQLVSQGAHVYICGGAASFGAAIRKTMTDLLWQGNCSGKIPDPEAATTFLQNMSLEGRWHEDLSD